MLTIDSVFKDFFDRYKKETGKDYLSIVKTSGYREGDKSKNPHAIMGNAMDFTLRSYGKYSGVNEYNDLFAYMFENWKFRAGIDNTWIGEEKGNVHIHIDLGRNRPGGQDMPFFFKENHGKYTGRITSVEAIA